LFAREKSCFKSSDPCNQGGRLLNGTTRQEYAEKAP
jgi:hypothetical protein